MKGEARNLPCTLLLLAPFAKVFPFPLSHIRHYPLLQERSLHFGRDDGARIALSKHIRCTLRGIDPFPHAVMRGAARNLPCTPSFLAPFAKGFPFFAISHGTLYWYAKKIPRLRSGWHCEENTLPTYPVYEYLGYPFSPYCHFERSEQIFPALCSSLPLSRKASHFTLSHIRRYTGV